MIGSNAPCLATVIGGSNHMKTTKPKFICVSVRMPKKLHDAVTELAQADQRKISEWIRLTVERAVEARKEQP